MFDLHILTVFPKHVSSVLFIFAKVGDCWRYFLS